MSMIQKLENSYLGVLRVVVIAASSLLLVAAIALGIWSVKGVLPATETVVDIEPVEPREVLEQVLPEEKKLAQASGQSTPGKGVVKIVNADRQAAYEKIYTMSAAFIGKFTGNVQTINKNSFFEYLDAKLSQYDSEEVRAQYLSGLTGVVDASFKSVRITAMAGTPATATATSGEPVPEAGVADLAMPPVNDKPINMVGSVINSYTELFAKKIAAAREKKEAAAAEMSERKAAAMTQLYLAGGLFVLFLLVVFLSIIIKIERNLREIAAKP